MYIGKLEANQKNMLNVASVNRSIAHQNEALTGKEHKDQDTLALSPGGRKQSMLETLMKQRQDLVDAKRKVTEDAKGVELKNRLEAYDKQIASLDEMIAQLQAQQEEEPKESSGIYERPKTEQQAQAQKSKQLMDIAAASDAVQTLSGLRIQMVGRANVLDAELKTKYNADPVAKAQESAELRGKATQIGNRMMQTLHDVTDTVEEMNGSTVDKEEEKEADKILE